MRSLSFRARLATAAIGVVALWLLAATTADAATVSETAYRTRRVVCDPDRPTRRELVQMGLLPPARTAAPVRRDVAAWLQRSAAHRLTNDEEAIPANAFVAGLPDDGRLEVALEPLGILVSSHATLPVHRPTARRSPRGPPVLG